MQEESILLDIWWHILNPEQFPSWPLDNDLHHNHLSTTDFARFIESWYKILDYVVVSIDVLEVLAQYGTETIVLRELKKQESQDLCLINVLPQSAFRGQEAVVQLLLNSGTDIEAEGSFVDGFSKDVGTALCAAAQSGQDSILRLLLEKGADVNGGSIRGKALFDAVSIGHELVVQILLCNGADVNARISQGGFRRTYTALFPAVFYGYEVVVRLLLESITDVEVRAKFAGEELGTAVQKGHDAIFRLLLESSTDSDEFSWEGMSTYGTTLYDAAKRGRESIVQVLLENGVDVTAKNLSGYTALHPAVSRGHEAVVRLLLESVTDIEARAKFAGEEIGTAMRKGHKAVVKLLIDNGAKLATGDCFKGLIAFRPA